MKVSSFFKRLFFSLLILSLVTLYGCREKQVTYADSGKTIHLVVDQILKVQLPADATSGSDWREMTYDNVIIAKKGKGNYMLGDGSSPGYIYFRFRAMIPGTTNLLMEYGDKYDSDEKATKTFEIEVVVHSKNEKY